MLRDGEDRGACISWKCRSGRGKAGSSSSRFLLFWMVVTGRYVVISSKFLMHLFLFLFERSFWFFVESVLLYFCAREAQIESSPSIHGMLHLDCDISLCSGERRRGCRFEREWWVQLSGCIACNLILILLCRDDRGLVRAS